MSLENPDRKERAWMDAIVALGCIVCRLWYYAYVPAVVHHIIKNGRRVGHRATIPLCPHHHNSGRNDDECVSRHPWKSAFERKYGTEGHLLNKTRELINGR